MTYWSLKVGNVEKTLADWGVTAATREVANLSKDTVNLTIQSPADAADPFPYGTKITLYRNH